MATRTTRAQRGGSAPREHAPGPVCRKQLTELNRRIDELDERGVEVIAISGDTAARAQRSVDEWKLDRLRVGYGLSQAAMREWGLFVSLVRVALGLRADTTIRFSGEPNSRPRGR